MRTDGNGTDYGAEKESDRDAIMRLALLPPLEFDRVCASEAELLRVTASVLKDQVKKARKPSAGKEAMQAHWKVEPWGEAVAQAKLFTQIKKRIKRHVIMSDHAATAVTLWVIFSWVHE